MSTVPLTVPDAMNRLFEIEERYDLLRFQLDGWSMWPMLRAVVFKMIATWPVARGGARKRNWGLAIRDVFSMAMLPHARYCVKTYCSMLVEKEEGKYKDIIFDDLLLATGGYLKIDNINNDAFLWRRGAMLCPSRCSTTGLEYIAGTISRIERSAAVEAVATDLSTILRTVLNLDGATRMWVRGYLRHFLANKQVVTWLLRRVKAEILLLADPNEWAWCAAARDSGIQVVEFQHGICDRNHYGYVWTRYATPYKEKMPLPQWVFLYGEHWRRDVDESGFWGGSLRVVGGLRVDEYRCKYKNIARERIPTLLVTTQGIDREALIQFIFDTQKDLVGKETQVWIKLHPTYDCDSTPYKRLTDTFPSVRIIAGAEEPSTFELLSRAHLHASISSTTHYDALALGTPTVIVPLESHEIVLNLHQSGHAHVVKTPAALALMIRGRTMNVTAEVREHYYKSGARENMIRELAQIDTARK